MKQIDYLLTTFKKTTTEILEIITNSNITGNFIVGNQCGSNSIEKVEKNGNIVTIYNQDSVGTSLNRNFILLKSNADFVTFLDDDQIMFDNMQDIIEKMVREKSLPAIRFNVLSDNPNRPNRVFADKNLTKRNVSAVGVWGVYFNRIELLRNNLLFNEKIGPGCSINHGEDSVFLYDCLKKFNILNININVFHVKQEDSTWQENRDLNIELFSHGYLLFYFYRNISLIVTILYILTHKKYYPKNTSSFYMLKTMIKGIKFAKKAIK